MTQGELGTAMVEGFGFRWENDQVVAMAEGGKRRFQLDEVLALASYFDVSPVDLLTAPGTDDPDGVDAIRTNGRAIPIREYRAWWTPSLRWTTSAVMAVPEKLSGRRRLERPWARDRRKGKKQPQAYMTERTRRLTDRAKANPNALLGPTAEPAQAGPVAVGAVLAPWGQTDANLVVPDGGRFVARDEVEREHVERLIESGALRRMDRRSRPRKAAE